MKNPPKRQGPGNCTISISRVVKKLCQDGQLERAIRTATDMHNSKLNISIEILYFLVQECIKTKDIHLGRRLHQLIITGGFIRDAFLGTHLIRMFNHCGSLWEAIQVFDGIRNPSVFTWNALISAHTMHEEATEAIRLYSEMRCSNVCPDEHVFVAALKACVKAEALSDGMLVHTDIVFSLFEPNSHVSNILVDMYMKFHNVEDAQSVFENVSTRDTITYTTLINGYTEHEYRSKAIQNFCQMQSEGISLNNVTYVSIFKACSDIPMLDHGIFLHSCMCEKALESDLTLGNALIYMYARCKRLREAHRVFSQLTNRDIVAWNSLIGGYAQQGHGHDALLMFHHMQTKGVKPDDVTFISILKACSTMLSFEQGNLMHAYIIDSGLESLRFVGNSLIDMYLKCGSLRDAYDVFKCIPEGDVISWNTLIIGHIDHQQYKEAFAIFRQMLGCDMEPDLITFVSLLEATTFLALINHGQLIHFCIILSGAESNVYINNSLIDLYTRCGRVEDAHNVFDRLPEKNIGERNPMLGNSAFHGGHDDNLPKLMQDDDLTNILKTCSNVVALDAGRLFHSCIIESSPELGISINNTLIDMYINCGNLDDACRVFEMMPDRDVVTWTMMIGGYGHHGDYNMAHETLKRMLSGEHKPVEITYVCLLNACGRSGLLNEGCLHFRSMMEIHGLTPTLDHYFCLVNIFGQLGRLAEAEDVLLTIPFSGASVVGIRTLLNHCKVHGNEILGQQYVEPLHLLQTKLTI